MFVIKDYSGNILHQGNLKDGLYSFTTTPSQSSPWALSSIRLSISCWHHKSGHVSVFVLNKVPSSSSILVDKNKIQYACLDCQMAQSHALLFKTSLHVSNKPLVLIFTDVRGLASIISNSSAR